jgi:hypothetical protein
MAYHSVCLCRNGKNRASYVEDRGLGPLLLLKCPAVVESNRQHCSSSRCSSRTQREAWLSFFFQNGKITEKFSQYEIDRRDQSDTAILSATLSNQALFAGLWRFELALTALLMTVVRGLARMLYIEGASGLRAQHEVT